MISLQQRGGRGCTLPDLVFMLPSVALLVTAANGHLDQALGGGDGMTVPFRS